MAQTNTANLENELKLGVPSGFSLARLPRNLKNYVASPATFMRLHTVYYDSADLRLMRWGCSLRFRRGEGWTLKIPAGDAAGDALARTEHVFAGELDRVPPEALDLASVFLRGAPVARVAELRTVRVKRDFQCDGDSVAEVVEDDVRVVDGTRVTSRFAQLEIELKGDGVPGALDEIAAALRTEGAGAPDPTPKNERAVETAATPEIALTPVTCESSLGDVVRAALGAAVVQYVRCDPLLRTTDDIETVHKARVAIRKLRSYLRTFVPVLDETWASTLRERLQWLQDALAPVRDADVFAHHMHQIAQLLPHADLRNAQTVLDSLDARRARERERLHSNLRDPRYAGLIDDLIDAVRAPRFTHDQHQRATACMARILKRVFKRTRKAVREAGSQPSDRALHRIRIKAKHLRYAAEAFAGAAGKRATRYAAKVEELQEILGAQHDSVVALERLRAVSAASAPAFAAGELAILAQADGARACKTWRKTWKWIEKRRSRFW